MQIGVFVKLKLANCARPGLSCRAFDLVPHMNAATRLFAQLFRLVFALVPFKRPLRRGVESKREFVPVGEALVILLYLTSCGTLTHLCAVLAGYRPFQGRRHPFVEAHSGALGSRKHGPVQRRLGPNHELPGERLLRSLPACLAERQVVLDRPAKAFFNSDTDFPWKVITSRRLMTSPWKISASSSYSTAAS